MPLTVPLAAAVIVASIACAPAAAPRAQAAPVGDCSGPQLRGRFVLVPGSAGAGQVSYRLRVTNVSRSACDVWGLPAAVKLFGARGRALPTHATAERPNLLTSVHVLVKPGASATATARFSPDVPGPGEGHPGRCEPIATRLRFAAAGGGMVNAPIAPPTSVCEHGTLRFSAFRAPA